MCDDFKIAEMELKLVKKKKKTLHDYQENKLIKKRNKLKFYTWKRKKKSKKREGTKNG